VEDLWTISYIAPLERAWARTRRLLFDRFTPERWLVIGFAAFLAGLVGEWTGHGLSPSRGVRVGDALDHTIRMPQDLLVHSMFNRLWFLGLPFLLLALLVTLVLLWVSSRGKFVFLDNLVQERAAIIAPWRRYARLGDSLFLWRLGYGLALLLLFGVIFAPLFLVSAGIRHWDGFGIFGVVAAMGSITFGLVVGIVAAYVALFLEGFVVPLMYQRGITATAAWRLVGSLVRRHPAEFLLVGLLVGAAALLVAACVFIVGLATCCLLFFALAVPYLNALLLLPLSSVFRLYTVEFLEQFGEEYRILPATPEGPAPAPTTTSISEREPSESDPDPPAGDEP
jgi:hypothetical protein